MRIITQPDGFVEVFEHGNRLAYVDGGKLFLVGSGAPLGDVTDRSDIIPLIKQHRAKCS